jgi:hypothetical protein
MARLKPVSSQHLDPPLLFNQLSDCFTSFRFKEEVVQAHRRVNEIDSRQRSVWGDPSISATGPVASKCFLKPFRQEVVILTALLGDECVNRTPKFDIVTALSRSHEMNEQVCASHRPILTLSVTAIASSQPTGPRRSPYFAVAWQRELSYPYRRWSYGGAAARGGLCRP